MPLDRSRPYGKICPPTEDGACFEQDHKQFRADGSDIDLPEKPQAKPAAKPTA
ncbi:hypothetical protein [Azospirillum sp. TSA2s]|uniref:hypothetical protein n=1 Tax=Azospirillum sp. TSA2s TaxID=709810 RepID=UPI00145B5A35|nr:hypothetical protein [Azospirillum sp. TSA2s]